MGYFFPLPINSPRHDKRVDAKINISDVLHSGKRRGMSCGSETLLVAPIIAERGMRQFIYRLFGSVANASFDVTLVIRFSTSDRFCA